MPARRAFSLLELTMAMAVFAVVLVAVLESMVNVSNYTGMAAQLGDLELQGQRLHQQFDGDLGNAAWMVSFHADTGKYQRDYPQVIPPAVPAASYGDELRFYRLRTERTTGSSGTDRRVATVNFAQDAATPMAHYAQAKPVTSLILNPAWVPDQPKVPFVEPVWDASNPALRYADAHDLRKLRQYRYVVRPDTVLTGRGILFREYRDGGLQAAWTSESRIADNIVLVRYFTNKEQPWLDPNQIRIVVDLKADDLKTGKPIATRHLEFTVAMRSLIDDQLN